MKPLDTGRRYRLTSQPRLPSFCVRESQYSSVCPLLFYLLFAESVI